MPSVTLTDSPLVFAGCGVVAPEYKWDDYAGLDCTGKPVVVLNDDPGNAGSDTTLFKGKALTLYSRADYKAEEAVRHGATGLLVIYDTRSASTRTWSWKNVQTAFSTPKARRA